MAFKKHRIPKHLIIHDNYDPPKSHGLNWFFLALIILAISMFISTAVQAKIQADIHNERASNHSTQAGMVFLENSHGERFQSLHLDSHAEVDINGPIASVNLVQDFKNDTDEWLDAVYVFPLPENAAVNHMEMQIDDRRIVGKIKEKKEAKKIYQEAKKAGKKAALTEQQRPNLFTQKVANIAPHQTIRISIRYTQLLNMQKNNFEWRLPTTITPRYIPGKKLNQQSHQEHGTQDDDLQYNEQTSQEEYLTEHQAANSLSISLNQFGWGFPTDQVTDAHHITPYMVTANNGEIINPISISIRLNSGLPLASIDSPYHDLTIKKEQNIHTIHLANHKESMDRDFVLSWQAVASAVPSAGFFSEKVNDEHYGLIMLLPPSNNTHITNLPREMIFVIDTSGSMQGTSINEAKASLKMALARLNSQDKFNIIEFNSYHSSLYATTRWATPENITQATQWVNRLTADGGTEMLPALKTTLSQLNQDSELLQQIVFITDGSIGNERALFSTIHHKLHNARLFTVGIGSAPNSFFMRKAAEFGRGTFTHIGKLEEVEEKMENLFLKLESAVATNIQITWPNDVEFYPNHIPDLYHGEPLVIAAKVEDLSGELIITGHTENQFWSESIQMNEARNDNGIASVWARQKIESLEDKKISEGQSEMLKQAIIDVALKHNLMSSHTSFVAVEEKVSRPQHIDPKLKLIPNAVAFGQKPQQGTIVLPKTATNAELGAWLGSFFFILFMLFIRMKKDDQ